MDEPISPFTVVVDDDPMSAKIIEKMSGIPSRALSDPDELLRHHADYHPIAFFIDIHLAPEKIGLDYLPAMQKIWPYTPILVISSDLSPEKLGKAFALGAHDFVQKPFRQGELVARMKTRIHELKLRQDFQTFSFGNVIFNVAEKSLKTATKTVWIKNFESKLFVLLAQNPGIPISKAQLRNHLWGDLNVSDNAIDKKISSLRRSLKDAEANITLKSRYKAGVQLASLSDDHSSKIPSRRKTA